MAVASTPATPPSWSLPLPRGRALALGGRPRVMGVLNLTPDSFSDGGRFLDPGRALDHTLAMIEAGADLIDLGAESTRPGGGIYGKGATPVEAAEELRRLLPVLGRLRAATDLPISVDTRKGEVARRALAEGADLINDVGALADPLLGEAVAEAGCPLILMHSRGDLASMQRGVHYDDLLGEVRRDLLAAVARAEAAGIDRSHLLLDPGIGFGKTAEHSLALLRHLEVLAALGFPVLVGASRKSFIGHVTGEPPDRRLPGSLAPLAWASLGRAAVVRVHDVAESVQFLRLFDAIGRATDRGEPE